jgi:hypothetical protein
MQLYRFEKATENNLPQETQWVLCREKDNIATSKIILFNPAHDGLNRITERFFSNEVEFLQPVTIADDWEEELKQKWLEWALNPTNISTTEQDWEWIKSNIIAPLQVRKEDFDTRPLMQCMAGRDAECNHPKCPVADEDVKNGKYCTLPLYDYRE